VNRANRVSLALKWLKARRPKPAPKEMMGSGGAVAVGAGGSGRKASAMPHGRPGAKESRALSEQIALSEQSAQNDQSVVLSKGSAMACPPSYRRAIRSLKAPSQ
jgi:hypothetical protein